MDDMEDRVSIRAHYERFPATVKGAFVLRGEDPNPHLVRIESARVAEVAGRGGRTIDLQPLTLDVAPHLDLFVPFEFPIAELGPGWYELACDLWVDGVPAQVRPGNRFPVAWPRATTRRGSVGVGKAVAAGDAKVRIEQVDCSGDSIKVTYDAQGPVSLKLLADGTAVPVIEEEFDSSSGRGRVMAYPVLKSQERLSIEVRGAAKPVEVRLP